VALGHDPLDVAAAALKLARGDEQQRTIAPISDVVEIREASNKRFNRDDRSGGNYRAGKRAVRSPAHSFSSASSKSAARHLGDQASHESGMVRLTLDVGKTHGIKPNDLVGTIAYHADIPGNAIGKIRIENQKSFVDVPEVLVAQVMKQVGKYKIRKQLVKVSLG
jgi:ATP-dependent RNA helicase DeaD